MKTRLRPRRGLWLKALLCALLLSLVASPAAYARTFVGPAALTIDGSFADWGTTSSPASGAYLYQDASNYGEQDGSGFNGKASDINYFWSAVSTLSGGTAPASPTNPIQYWHYRLDTRYNRSIKGQSYYVQLNLGTASPGYADHLLQIWVNVYETPRVKLVLYQYQTPYPQIRAFTSGTITGLVSNVANPYPGFTGVQDTSACGATGKYDGTNYGVEVRLPVNWFSATYGGAVQGDGSGAAVVAGAIFTGTGSLGAIGTVKDTLNDTAGKTRMSLTSTLTGDTTFVTDAISQIVFTTGPQTLTVGQVSGIMSIQTQDGTGAAKNVSGATTVGLTSTSATGRFDTSPGGAFDGSITSVTIAGGTSSASFYYKDTSAGTPAISAAESPPQGWTDAAQQQTVTGLLPAAGTDNATAVEETIATLHGSVTGDGGEACQYRFEYGTASGGPYPYNTAWSGSVTTGQSFSANITGLGRGTKYYFRAQVKNSAGTGSGSELSLLTKPDQPLTFVTGNVSDTQIDLIWTKGEGALRTMVRRNTGDYPADREDGVLVYFDSGTSVSDSGLTPGTTYYYKAWSEVSGSQQWSDGFTAVAATTGGGTTPPEEPTAVGGIIYPVDKARVLAPWFSLLLAVFSLPLITAFLQRSSAPTPLPTGAAPSCRLVHASGTMPGQPQSPHRGGRRRGAG